MDPQSLSKAISDACDVSGNRLGWRLLYSPWHVVSGADVAFIGMNPGGNKPSVQLSTECGSAYVTESWADKKPGKSTLQIQVRHLFSRLGVLPDQVLAGNLIPFRSPNWASLQSPKYCIEFGKYLWEELIQQAKPKLIISMGGETTEALASSLMVKNLEKIPVNWGNVGAVKGELPCGYFIGLPHLSRFTVMTRDKSCDALDALFSGLSQCNKKP